MRCSHSNTAHSTHTANAHINSQHYHKHNCVLEAQCNALTYHMTLSSVVNDQQVVMEVRQMRQLMKEKRQLLKKERKGLLLQRYSVFFPLIPERYHTTHTHNRHTTSSRGELLGN